MLSSARAWTSDILAAKRDIRRHCTKRFSENVVAEIVIKMLEVSEEGLNSYQ